MAASALIALYGSLMRGFDGQRDAGVEDALTWLGRCTIPGRLIDLGRYPGLVPGPGAVQGELHEIRDRTALGRLDAFEGYEPLAASDSLFVRRPMSLLEPSCEAWVYVYAREVGAAPEIVSGSWRSHLTARRCARSS